MSISKLEFIKQKLDELQAMERQRQILISGINELLRIESRNNIDIGAFTVFEHKKYEIIDYKVAEIRGHMEYNEIYIQLLCLLTPTNKHTCKISKKIRHDKKWYGAYYLPKQKATKNFYEKHIKTLMIPFTAKEKNK